MILHPEAQLEYREAVRYYERQRVGLGEEFIAAVEEGFDQIERRPDRWRKLRKEIRRLLLKRYPYGIVYAVCDGQIYVAAVAHLKREPDYWLGRLKFLPEA